MNMEYLIYCKGNLDEHIEKIEELCFFYKKKVELSVLKYDIGKFEYRGNDLKEDAMCLRSIDDTLRIEEIPTYNALKKR